MRRREFITLLGGASAAWPLAARAQQGERVRRVGVLSNLPADDPASRRRWASFEQELQQLGWSMGRNLRIDYRLGGVSRSELARTHAAELVALAPDVIYATPTPAVMGLVPLTSTIPIVYSGSGDPVQAGVVQSINRPGGNVTGFSAFPASLNTKQLQLLKELAPRVSRVAVVQTQGSSWRGDFAVIDAVAHSFAITPVAMLVRDDPAEIERAFAAFAREPNGGLILPPDNNISRQYAMVAALAARHRLPAITSSRTFVDTGGLMSYGAVPLEMRSVASYVDRILKGEKPADLPVQHPTKFEFVINMKTAKTLGLTVSNQLQILADEVIE
jgi:putative tryptophan/tyrosine transport system substrate-binding protein